MIENVVRVLFFGALLTSLSVYAWRAYRHVVHKETRHDRTARRQAAAARDATTTTGTGPRDGGAGDGGPAKPAGFLKTAFAPPSLPDDQIEDGSLVRDVIRQELAKKQAAAPGAPGPAVAEGAPPAGEAEEVGRTGLFAKPHRSVADLVVGIRLPCDLAPLVDGDLDPDRAVFATSGHTPATVASSLADELERLGFRIDTAADNEAVARKPEGDLRIVIHDDLEGFPQAPRDGVVVELLS